MGENPFVGVDRFGEILVLVEQSARKFSVMPSKRSLEVIAGAMAKRLRIVEADRILADLHTKWKWFPKLRDFQVMIDKAAPIPPPEPKKTYVEYHNLPPAKPKEAWVSKQAPGTPPYAEAIFEMKRHHQGPLPSKFRAWGKLGDLTHEEFEEAYSLWGRGHVHPKLLPTDGEPHET